jgi:predicted transglutaminase-like cysteine proteinase
VGAVTPIKAEGKVMRWSRLCSNAVVFLFVSVIPALAALPPATSLPGAAAMPALFNTQEIFRGDNSPFKQWGEMVGRTNTEFTTASTACNSRRPECELNEWTQLVAQLSALPLRDKVIRANAVLNAVPYVLTARNWGRPMYWEAPLEFLAYGGQCQDYAIAKYVALRQAGVPADQMRIVVLRATDRGEDHAVLVVDVDGEAMMLDNMHTGVVPTAAEASYRPYYSINELGWWQHKASALTQTAQR